MVPGQLPPTYADIRELRIFAGIPDDILLALVNAGQIELRSFVRDVIVADPVTVSQGAAPVFFIAQGQVAAAVFDPRELAKRREDQVRYEQMSEAERQELSLIKPPPMARVAQKNVAHFREGDLFNAGALVSASGEHIAFFTLSRTSLVAMQAGAIAELAARHPSFEARFRRAIQHSRARLNNVTGVKQEVLDFFVRQGISVSGPTVRVRQLDLCIDCKQCEQACEERYGSKRLTLGGYQLGMLDFVFTCRTCSDQRCVDPCEYDSIKYDAKLGEVVINESTCVGCTACAQSCPYHAIEMVDVADPQNPTYREDFKARLEATEALTFGAGTPRLSRPRRIANKCDHCFAFREQACVSACPTGALVELSAYDLFRERSRSAKSIAEIGYDRDIKPSGEELLPTEPFTEGIGMRDAGKARVRRGKMIPVITWGLGLAAFFAFCAEVILQVWWKENSLHYFVLMQETGITPGIALDKVNFRPGNWLTLWAGYIGTSLMGVACIYPFWRRMKVFRWIASNTMWFDFHLMTGTVGPMFIVIHAAFKLDNWVSLAFWSMVIVVLSGFIGRYLYTQVPDLLNGRELEELEHERALAKLRENHPQAGAQADAMLQRHRQATERISQAGGITAFFWILGEDIKRPFRWMRRRSVFSKTNVPKKVARNIARRVGRMMLIDRRRVLIPRAQLLLHSWKKVHVPFTIIMTIISLIHIWVAFQYSM